MGNQLLNMHNTILTEEKAISIINENKGLFGLLGADGYGIDCTTKHLSLFSAGKFRCRKQIRGKRLEDLYRHKDIAGIYSKNYETTRKEKYFRGIVPLILNDDIHYGLIQKIPVYTSNLSELVGFFSQLVMIDNKKLSDLLYGTQLFQKEIGLATSHFFKIDSGNDNCTFTQRETQCLFYTIRGASAKMVANKLNLSPKTVEFYIDNLKEKFGCYSKSDLIAKAIDQGYLTKIPTFFSS